MAVSKGEPEGNVDEVQLHLGKAPPAADADARLRLELDLCRRLTSEEPTPKGTAEVRATLEALTPQRCAGAGSESIGADGQIKRLRSRGPSPTARPLWLVVST